MSPEAWGAVLFLALCALMDWRARSSTAPPANPDPESGPKWEQDEPYALMLDDLDEED